MDNSKMTIQEAIEQEAIDRAREVAAIFGIKDFQITVDVFNVRSGEFKVKFESNSNGINMAKSNLINAAAIVGIEEECRWNEVTCDFHISISVGNN